jgi:hypothetical protein
VIGQRPSDISNNFAQMSLLSNEVSLCIYSYPTLSNDINKSNGMPLSPSQMLAGMDPYYYMNQPIYPRQPVRSMFWNRSTKKKRETNI